MRIAVVTLVALLVSAAPAPAQAADVTDLESRLSADSRDASAIRATARLLRATNPAVRREAARLAGTVGWPWLDAEARDALLNERDEGALAAAAHLVRHAASEEAFAVFMARREALAAVDPALAADILFHLATTRPRGARFVGAFPGPRDPSLRGLLADSTLHPLRGVAGLRVSLDLPELEHRVLLGFGYYLPSDQPVAARARLAEVELGRIDLMPGAADLPRLSRAGATAVPMSRAIFLTAEPQAAGPLEIELDETPPKGLFVHGVVALDETALAARPWWRTLRPGSGLDRSDDGASADVSVVVGDAASFDFVLADGEARRLRGLEIDHAASEPTTFSVALDERPLVNLLSQPLPRAARAPLSIPLAADGRHRLDLRRVSGTAPLEVTALRLIFSR